MQHAYDPIHIFRRIVMQIDIMRTRADVAQTSPVLLTRARLTLLHDDQIYGLVDRLQVTLGPALTPTAYRIVPDFDEAPLRMWCEPVMRHFCFARAALASAMMSAIVPS